MTYALREALAIVLEEGLDDRIARHATDAPAAARGPGSDGHWLCAQTFAALPQLHPYPGRGGRCARAAPLAGEYGIEIGGGLGPMAGKAWRIGLMGHGATVRNVDLVLTALRECLR